MADPVNVNSKKLVNRQGSFKKLRMLSCFEDVHQKVIDGWSLPKLAEWIQEDQKVYTDVTRESLILILNNYRKALPPGTLVAQRMPNEFIKAKKKLQAGIDEVEELEWLTKFQKRRLRIDGEIEKKLNKLLPSMTQEVRAHVEVLRTLATVKMDLGVNKRHLGTMEVDATVIAEVSDKYGSAAIGKVLSDPAARQKVMGIAEKIMALSKHQTQEDDAEFETITVEAKPSAPSVPLVKQAADEVKEETALSSTEVTPAPPQE